MRNKQTFVILNRYTFHVEQYWFSPMSNKFDKVFQTFTTRIQEANKRNIEDGGYEQKMPNSTVIRLE
jgi:hypothetical protein